jgi:proteasome activator subunit 4
MDRDAEAHLAAYLKNVPYKCETNDAMQEKLQTIVGRIVLCAQCKDWKSLTTWIGVFQWSGVLSLMV